MARKSLNFVNSLRNVFRRKHSNIQPQVEAVQETKRQVRRKKEAKKSVYRPQKQSHFVGGGRKSAASSLAAIYYPPSRGKFKGYMRKAC